MLVITLSLAVEGTGESFMVFWDEERTKEGVGEGVMGEACLKGGSNLLVIKEENIL